MAAFADVVSANSIIARKDASVPLLPFKKSMPIIVPYSLNFLPKRFKFTLVGILDTKIACDGKSFFLYVQF